MGATTSEMKMLINWALEVKSGPFRICMWHMLDSRFSPMFLHDSPKLGVAFGLSVLHMENLIRNPRKDHNKKHIKQLIFLKKFLFLLIKRKKIKRYQANNENNAKNGLDL